MTVDEVAEFIERFAKVSNAPVRTGVNVTSVRRAGDGFRVTTSRGEIACRIIRTAKRMALRTVAVYSDPDRDAMHVALADAEVAAHHGRVVGPPHQRPAGPRPEVRAEPDQRLTGAVQPGGWAGSRASRLGAARGRSGHGAMLLIRSTTGTRARLGRELPAARQ